MMGMPEIVSTGEESPMRRESTGAAPENRAALTRHSAFYQPRETILSILISSQYPVNPRRWARPEAVPQLRRGTARAILRARGLH